MELHALTQVAHSYALLMLVSEHILHFCLNERSKGQDEKPMKGIYV